MQFPCNTSITIPKHFIGFHNPSIFNRISCNSNINGKNRTNNNQKPSTKTNTNSRERVVKVKKAKENVWSFDNDIAMAAEAKENNRGKKTKKKDGKVSKKSKGDGKLMVSGAMLMEVETVLQTQEPVILPAWNTFASSVSGLWKGVGAVFSPINAEMEPIDVGNKNEYLFDCYTLCRLTAVSSPSTGQAPLIERKINWVTLNPHGEVREDKVSLPKFESFDIGATDVMEEDYMGMEPGLVYFEDGSYSRGPIEIPVEADQSERYISQTFKFEQCLVKGCHIRLRIVHTIDFNNGASDIQIMRVAVYEEEWDSPSNVELQSDLTFDLKPFSQRKRIQPSDLTGSWKIFETSATPIYDDDLLTQDINDTPYVYLCTETLKRRNQPESLVYFTEEEMFDMQDTTVLWLPGGVTSYVDVDSDGVLCIGVGWYSNEGINLVMERDYGVDGKLKDVRMKSEVKRR